MDIGAHTPEEQLPPDLQKRLAGILPRLPATWRVQSVRAQGRDWLVDLVDEQGQGGCQLVLLGERTWEETHGAWPRGSGLSHDQK